jgi:hypothetical protein
MRSIRVRLRLGSPSFKDRNNNKLVYQGTPATDYITLYGNKTGFCVLGVLKWFQKNCVYDSREIQIYRYH